MDFTIIKPTSRFAALTEEQLAIVGMWVQDILIKFDGVSQAPLSDIWALAFDLRDRTDGDITVDHGAFIVSNVFRYRNMEELVGEMFGNLPFDYGQIDSYYDYDGVEIAETQGDVIYTILHDKGTTDIEKADRLDLKVELRHNTAPGMF